MPVVLRSRRQERREDSQTFHPGGDAVQYQVREELFSIGDDFWIVTNQGDKAFNVNGKALRVRKTLYFKDPYGSELARIQDRPVRIRESMEVDGLVDVMPH